MAKLRPHASNFNNNYDTLQIDGNVCPDVSPSWNGSGWVNGRGLGTTTQFWKFIDCAYYFAKDLTFISFDTLDDLSLVKNYKTKQAGARTVVDLESLPCLKPDDSARADRVDISKTASFLLGCVKALVLRVEALESQLKQKQAVA